MNNLETVRAEISAIDEQMAKLFERRMKATEEVANYKKERGLPVKDPVREAAMVEKYSSFITDPCIESHYIRFLKNTIDISCDYQMQLMNGMKVAYCGVEGAFASIAAEKMFPGAQLVPCADFEGAYRAVENGQFDCAVLPMENSYAGEVGSVMDLVFSGELYINQVMDLAIRHHLVGLPEASASDIKKVVRHPKALEQCAEFIHKSGLETQNYSNTAAAAQYVSELKDCSVAAIASEATAEKYGLKILESGINDRPDNMTRFAAVSRVQNRPATTGVRENESFIIVFTVQNKAGALAQTLNIIGAHGYNMRTLRSRPMKDLQWNYFFYIEAEGNIHTTNGQDMLRELSAICARLKLVGTYCTDSTK
ncbi:MAG: chorismate mutase [Clostridia bacterium]|nr:chorismate mutase [Clostridia bacterium]